MPGTAADGPKIGPRASNGEPAAASSSPPVSALAEAVIGAITFSRPGVT